MNMLEKVLYLCFINKGEEGFVFPRDIDENQYNPGIFMIIADDYYKLNDLYHFVAIDGEIRITTELKRFNSTTYGVKTKYGLFLFRIKKLAPKYCHFFGTYNMFPLDKTFYELIPMQSERLESICRASNFYFIGSTDDENELPPNQSLKLT
jgi:hypothetical protein